MVAGVEALGLDEAHVVGVERVGHDEVRHDAAVALRDLGPERQLVAVVVAVVFVAALIDDEAARVRAVAAGVPAERPSAAGQLLDDEVRDADVAALGRLGHVLVVDPAQAVVRDLMVLSMNAATSSG